MGSALRNKAPVRPRGGAARPHLSLHLSMRTLRTSVLIAAAALALPAAAQTTFQGFPAPGGFFTLTDVSADASAMVGFEGAGQYLWTSANPTFTQISTHIAACEVSNGGAFVAATLPDPGNGNLETAARWTASSGQWMFLPGLNGASGSSLSSVYDMSADGSVIVGLAWITPNIAHAFRWDAVNGTVDLGSAGGSATSSRPNCLSADGNVAAGWDADFVTGAWRASMWSGGAQSLLGSLDPNDPINGWGEAYAISGTGQFIVGGSPSGLSTPSGWNQEHLFRWDAVNGLVDRGTTNLDPFAWGSHLTTPTGVSDDGNVIVGQAGVPGFFGPGQKPFIAREGSPMALLADDLIALGVPEASTWTLASVEGISGNGRVIVGTAYDPNFASYVYHVEFPPVSETYCTAKVNSLGCTPAIGASGVASVSALAPFAVTATQVLNNKNGLLYFGFSSAALPFQGGTRCVGFPSIRTGQQDSGGSPSGNDCTGAYSFDFNALIQSGAIPSLTVGAQVYAQYWSRDPQAASTTGLSDGAGFSIFP